MIVLNESHAMIFWEVLLPIPAVSLFFSVLKISLTENNGKIIWSRAIPLKKKGGVLYVKLFM